MSAEVWGIISLCGYVLAAVLLVASMILFVVMRIPSVIGDLTGRTVAREMEKMRQDNTARGDRQFRTGRINRERGPLTEKTATGKMSKTGKTSGGKKNAVQPAAVMPRQKTDTMGTMILPPEETTAHLGTEKLSEKEVAWNARPTSGTVALGAGIPLSETTEILSDDKATEVLNESNATAVLSDNNATEVLQYDSTTEVLSDSNATAVLSDSSATEVLRDNSATTVLDQEEQSAPGSTEELAKKKAPAKFKVTRDIVVTHDDKA